MAWFDRILNTFRLGALHRELDEELRHHLESRVRDLERSGMGVKADRTEAARMLGNITLEKERMRDMDIAGWLETIFKDLRYAVRQLLRNPGFTVVAVASLALGIGANTAIFSVLNAALLKSLPVRNPEQLVMLTDPNQAGVWTGTSHGERGLLTYTEFAQLRDHSTTLASLCASEASLNRWAVRIAANSQEQAEGRLVSEEYFSTFGLEPAIGRFFTPNNGSNPGSDSYAVISYNYWQKRFGGSTAVLGTLIHLYNATVTVIGVAPPRFRGETVGQNPDIWLPMMMEPMVKPGRDWIHEDLSKSLDKIMWLQVFGRLKPGATLAQAQAEMNVLFHGIMETGYPATLSPQTRKDLLNQHLKLREARTGAFEGRSELSQQLLVLLIVAGLVLLIACANVANLLLARATARHKEVGIRLSIGAAKGRLIRQFLTESLLLSVVGGIAGVLVALGAGKLLLLLLSNPVDPIQLSTSFDWRVLAFTIGVTLLTGLLFGLAPAIRSACVDINESLKETSRGVTNSGRRLNFAKMLVAGQVALSLLLVVGAGLFLRTLWNLQSVSLGYPKEHSLLLRVDGLTAGYKDARLASLYGDIADLLRVLPGIRGVTFSAHGLFSGHESDDPVDVEGFVHKSDEDSDARFDQIGPSYFSTLGIPLLLGREISPRDTSNSLRVCVINETFAKRFFAGRNPIGKHITDTYGDGRLTMQVVGVAKNARDHALRGDVPPRFYVPVAQGDGPIAASVYFELRTVGDPNRMLDAVRKTILHVDQNLPITEARSIDELLYARNTQPRMIARLCTIFGLIALLLAATGLYGVLSYGVARRTNEIGLRMALGAGRSSVVGMILRETSAMIAIGIVVGILASVAATRLIATRLYGLGAMDPITIGIAVAILGTVALISAYIPAARAARVNPVSALRHE
jgi:predicted permease